METKLPPLSQRIVTALLAVVMVVGLAPTQAYANTSKSASESNTPTTVEEQTQSIDADQSAESAQQNITSAVQAVEKASTTAASQGAATAEEASTQSDQEAIPAGQAQLTLKGVHSAQVNSLKLYTYTNGQKGTTNLLDGVELVDSPDGGNQMMYVTTVDTGDYWVEGYDANNSYNGGIAISVVEGNAEANVIKIQRAYQIYASNTKTVDGKSVKWEFGTDYTVDYVVKDPSGNVHATDFGEADSWGTIYKSSLFIAGGTISATFNPAGDYADDYLPTTVTKSATQTTSALSISASIPKTIYITVNAPAGSTISVGNMATYYVYTWFEGTVTKNDATGVSETFRVPSSMSGNRFYRVQNPNGVTYWNYAKNWSSDETVEVTAADLHIGATDFTKDTVYRFDKNVLDRADIYLNINQQGYKNMQVGDTFELNVFRNWMAIESFMNSKVALPDMHYTVIDTQGNASDVVSITPDANNSSVATMTANKAGTAIVMVTYDAMTHKNGYNYNSSLSTDPTAFSAIWPECTGMFVVNVGEDGSSIQTNMMMERIDRDATSIDAEHDILFYLGDEGASYSFTPESGTTVTVDRSVVTDKMTFNGFTSEGVETNAETGEVTVSGLTTGRHIIKVEKNGVANYQVVTARETSYEVLDEKGNEIEDLSQIKAGDTIQLQFSNLVMPCEKMSGVYNMNASIYYEGEDGTLFRSNPGSSYGVYDFSGNPVRQLISLTIPKYWDGDTYSLTGAIKLGGFMTYNPGGHRGITYAAGINPNYNAPEANSVLSAMPELSISLAKTDFIQGTFNFTDKSSGKKIDVKDFTKIEVKDAEGNAVNINEDGTFNALAEKYTYTTYIDGYRYATGEIEVSEDGQNVFNVQLESSSDGAWDGVSTSEPEQDENGVYQIKTGAELAWISEQSNLSKDAMTEGSFVLCNDIDLAGYPWTKGIKGNGGMIFDGAGHKITGLNSSVALIDNIGGTGSVSNLTVKGVTTGPAGIVKSLNGGSITNCVSDVDITPTDTSYIGGIVGSAAAKTTVSKCINKGTISAANANYVGGIVGRSSGADFKLINSYNTASVAGKGYVGGAIGYVFSGSDVTACYNLGNVEGTSNVGGFAGSASSSSFASCYSAGTVTGGNQFIGSGTSTTYDKCYALSGAGATDSAAELLGAADLKNADLPNWYFAPTCTGYPALLWQTDVTFHEASGEGTVVAPNCLNKGYTSHTCSKCNGIFKTDYTESTGHTVGEDLHVYPTRYEYTCTVCNQEIVEYNDDRLKDLTFPDENISAVTIEDNGSYPWKSVTNGLESTCQGVSNGVSESNLKFTFEYGGTVSFDYAVSSEARYDKLTITLQKPDGSSVTVCNEISGTNSGTFTSGDLGAGQYTLKLYYKKDSGGNTGDDKGSILNFAVTCKSETEAVNAAIAAINSIVSPVTLDSEDSIVAARETYNGLPASAQAKVTNYNKLVSAESDLAALKAPDTDKAAADSVVSTIDAIGTPVTLDKSDKVEAARAAYDALTDAQKALVTNYNTLVEAESTIDALNKAQADSVALQIYALGKVRPGVSDEAIANARAAYDALTDAQKALVPNYQTLVDAEAALDSGYAKQVFDKIDMIGDVTLDSEDTIVAARTAYDALTDTQKELVSNYSVLEQAEDALYNLKVPKFVTDELPFGYIGETYEATLEVTGTPTPTVTVTNLPTGLEYNADTGVISGTPTKVGSFIVEVEASNEADTIKTAYEIHVSKKSTIRVAGSTRIDTMAQIVEKSVADGSQSVIFLTTANNYADALSASGLLGVMNASLLTTDPSALSYETKKQIERISDGSASIYILGGEGAVSDDVAKELESMTCVGEVERISGNGRVETGNKIYEKGGENWGDTCVIVNAWNYADALSIGSFCAENKAPIFGATGGTITQEQADAIKAGGFTKVVIVGGTSAVDPEAVQAMLEASDSGDEGAASQEDADAQTFEYLVLAGSTRIDTSKMIVDWSCGNYADAQFQPQYLLNASNVCFSTAWNYADALAGINLSCANNAPIMLVDDSDASTAAITEVVKGGLTKCWILGGTGAVSSDVEDLISGLM